MLAYDDYVILNDLNDTYFLTIFGTAFWRKKIKKIESFVGKFKLLLQPS